jgi:hypothetical protein
MLAMLWADGTNGCKAEHGCLGRCLRKRSRYPTRPGTAGVGATAAAHT